MKLSDIEINLKKLHSEFVINEGANAEQIKQAQEKLGVKLPGQVIQLYESFNGLSVVKPKLEIFEIGQLEKKDNIIKFALFNGAHPIGFDTSHINDAEQWSIINTNTGFVLTLTVASLLTNKIWAWLHRDREIWADEKYT